jgi:hypothetical protein
MLGTTLLCLLTLPPWLGAQETAREVRPRLMLTLPRWNGIAVLLLKEQHLAMRDLAQVEDVQGIGLVGPQLAFGSPSVELRQVRQATGLIEHRWIPTLYLGAPLPHGLEWRDRARVELRDIAGSWSRRYQNRATVAYPVDVGGVVIGPFVHLDLSYDTRYSALNRRELGAGLRVPIMGRTLVDSYLMRQTDSQKTYDALIAACMIVRVTL